MVSPLTLRSAIRTRRQFLTSLGAIQDRIDVALEGTAPEQAPLRRELRKLNRQLDASEHVNLLFPPTRAAIAQLVAVGLATQAEADRALAVPAEDIPPMVAQPAGTVAATWDGWPVWAAQPAPGEAWMAQTPDGDVEIRHPDFLVTLQLGGAQYRARSTELEL